jgi:hypothetical protein
MDSRVSTDRPPGLLADRCIGQLPKASTPPEWLEQNTERTHATPPWHAHTDRLFTPTRSGVLRMGCGLGFFTLANQRH